MKRTVLYLSSVMLIVACAYTQMDDTSFAKMPTPAKGEKIATFAGGCFWAMEEAMSELKGVNKVISGYAGGTVKNPTYEQVCTRTTGHAETVQVYYNPALISYASLAEAFFYAHDPTTLNRQGPDVGDDYRSAAFFRSPEERLDLENVIKKVTNSNHYSGAIVTQVVPFKVFYPAETYHQGYYKAHPNQAYIRAVSEPKVMKLRKAFPELLKPQFKPKKV